jgi:phage terminase small subunit
MNRLTPKQERFIQEYLIDLNASQAALRAGYRNGGSGSQLIRKDHVSRAVEAAKEARANRMKVTADYVLENLKTVVERCLQHEPVEKWNPERRKREHVTDTSGNPLYQFDSTGANRALELIGRHLGLFKDKIEHSEKSWGLAEFIREAIADRETE